MESNLLVTHLQTFYITIWHAASLNISAVKRTNTDKHAFKNQLRCTACIVVKVMLFHAQRSDVATLSIRSKITFHQ